MQIHAERASINLWNIVYLSNHENLDPLSKRANVKSYQDTIYQRHTINIFRVWQLGFKFHKHHWKSNESNHTRVMIANIADDRILRKLFKFMLIV